MSIINKTREIVYEVTNSGSVTTTYDVRIMDDFSSAVPPVKHQYNISAGDRVKRSPKPHWWCNGKCARLQCDRMWVQAPIGS
jgi:hypothetical protein